VQASLACVVTGPPQVSSVDKIRGRDGKEVLSQNRNFNMFQQKALRVRRLYDEKRNAIVYVAYSTRLNNATDEGAASVGRYKCGPYIHVSCICSSALEMVQSCVPSQSFQRSEQTCRQCHAHVQYL
jgi:hypothetical protein